MKVAKKSVAVLVENGRSMEMNLSQLNEKGDSSKKTKKQKQNKKKTSTIKRGSEKRNKTTTATTTRIPIPNYFVLETF